MRDLPSLWSFTRLSYNLRTGASLGAPSCLKQRCLEVLQDAAAGRVQALRPVARQATRWA